MSAFDFPPPIEVGIIVEILGSYDGLIGVLHTSLPERQHHNHNKDSFVVLRCHQLSVNDSHNGLVHLKQFKNINT